MWRKLIIMLAFGLLFLSLAVPVWAASPTSVPFQGQAQISSSEESLRLNLSVLPRDNAGWQINTVLNSTRSRNSESEDDDNRSSSTSRSGIYQLTGNFTLKQNQYTISGPASGAVYSSGQGQVILVSADQSVNLQLDFTIAANSVISGYVQGQFGPITAASPSVTPATVAPPPDPTPSPSQTVSQAAPSTTPAVVAPLQSQTPKATTTQTAAIPVVPAGPSPTQPAEATQNHSFWYLSRTAAILAYILLFINIVLGLGMKTKFLDKISARWQSFDLHQFTALLAMALISLHIFSLLGDRYMSPTLSNLLVPMSGSYRPVWTALGIISFYVLIVIVLSSYLRRFIGQKIWRLIHILSFVLFYVILYHGLRSGTDTTTVWAQVMYILTGTVTAFLFLWRFLLAGRSVKETATVQKADSTGPDQVLK